MKASELIILLADIIKEHGDVEALVLAKTCTWPDGGWYPLQVEASHDGEEMFALIKADETPNFLGNAI